MKLSPEQKATVRAAMAAQARAERRSWWFWGALIALAISQILLGYLAATFLFWSASFAPSGWFAWACTAICVAATCYAARVHLIRARRLRIAWLAGRSGPSTLGSTVCLSLAAWMTVWSTVAATYVSSFGATSAHVGPRIASAMLHLLLHGGR